MSDEGYQVEVTTHASRQIRKLPAETRKTVIDAITALGVDPRPAGCTKLRGRPAWRIRAGRYRVIYEIDDHVLLVTVIQVGHRRDIYKQ